MEIALKQVKTGELKKNDIVVILSPLVDNETGPFFRIVADPKIIGNEVSVFICSVMVSRTNGAFMAQDSHVVGLATFNYLHIPEGMTCFSPNLQQAIAEIVEIT